MIFFQIWFWRIWWPKEPGKPYWYYD